MSVMTMAVDAYLRVLRMPVDLAVGALGGDEARLTVDRLDATLREVAGSVLRDEGLLADAGRRQVAADERERALRLRDRAERVEETGRQRAQQRRQTANERRVRETERVESRARRERLGAAGEKLEALDHAEDALVAQDEAERLGEAAARAKARRKGTTKRRPR